MSWLTMMVIIMSLVFAIGGEVSMKGMYSKNCSIKRIIIRMLCYILVMAVIVSKIG